LCKTRRRRTGKEYEKYLRERRYGVEYKRGEKGRVRKGGRNESKELKEEKFVKALNSNERKDEDWWIYDDSESWAPGYGGGRGTGGKKEGEGEREWWRLFLIFLLKEDHLADMVSPGKAYAQTFNCFEHSLRWSLF
jgi:hypothetical protein